MPRSLNIRWAEPRQPCSDWNCKPDSVVWISIEKLDAAWKHDTDAYIGTRGTGAAIENRYEQFGKWLLATGEPVELPAVGLDDDGSVGFTDGRHRFAWLRDHGVHSMRVQVPADQAAEIELRFGTGDRTSFVPA